MKKSYPIGKTLGRLVRNAWRQNKRLFLSFGIYTLAAAVYPMLAVALPKLVLGELTRAEPSAQRLVFIVAAFFAAAGSIGFLATYLKNTAYHKLSLFRLEYLKDMMNKILTMRYCNTEDAKFYDEHERAMNAANSNEEGIEGVYHVLFEGPAVLLTVLAYVVFIGLKSMWILAALLLHVAAVYWASRETHVFRHSLHAEIGHAERRVRYYSDAANDFSFGKDVRLYGFKARILDNFRREIDAYTAILTRIARREFLLGFAALATLLLSDTATYGILIRDVVHGMPIADFSMYLAAAMSLSALFKRLAEMLGKVYSEGEYVYDFFRMLDEDMGERGGTRPAIAGDTLEIEFKNVSFRYPRTEKYIFRNLNFTIHKGERLAIVGVNGAGKTTLVKLMTGLLEPTEGEIAINGIPIGEFEKKALYSMFSVVFQDVNVLAYTVLENVACHPDGDRARAMDALSRVGLGEKVRSFRKGLDQTLLKIIEEDGTELSGGEAQKLSIARALYKDANMVIMDEPTAALDALAEAEIYQNFAELVQGKTAVYISHRLASTKFCDHIALFDGNGLAEYGSHAELMVLGGKYCEMFTVQGKYYSEAPEEVGA